MSCTPGQQVIWLTQMFGRAGTHWIDGRLVHPKHARVVAVSATRIQIRVMLTAETHALIWVDPANLLSMEEWEAKVDIVQGMGMTG